MSEPYQPFLPECDWQKGETPPEGRMRIMEEGRAHLYGSNRASKRLLSRLQARRHSIVLLLQRSYDERVQANASIFADCTDQSSCCSNACPICRTNLGMILMSRILAAREHQPVGRVCEILGGKFSKPLHNKHYVDFPEIKKFCRELVEQHNTGKSWVGWIDVRATLSYPQILEAAWWPRVEMFSVGGLETDFGGCDSDEYIQGVSKDNLTCGFNNFPIMGGHPAGVDIELVEDGRKLEKRVVQLVKIEALIRHSDESVFDCVFLFNSRMPNL